MAVLALGEEEIFGRGRLLGGGRERYVGLVMVLEEIR